MYSIIYILWKHVPQLYASCFRLVMYSTRKRDQIIIIFIFYFFKEPNELIFFHLNYVQIMFKLRLREHSKHDHVYSITLQDEFKYIGLKLKKSQMFPLDYKCILEGEISQSYTFWVLSFSQGCYCKSLSSVYNNCRFTHC